MTSHDPLPPSGMNVQDPPPPVPGQLSRATDAALLAAWLSRGRPWERALNIAEVSQRACGGLRGLFALSDTERAALPGWNDQAARQLSIALELVRRQLRDELCRGEALCSPGDTLDYLQAILVNRRREIFLSVFLDTRHRVIHCEELFKGSIDGASVYPRVVAEKALRCGSAAVIIAHNHPSGVSEPSLADQAITRRLKDALGLFDIRLLDHFVIGDGQAVSLASRGML